MSYRVETTEDGTRITAETDTGFSHTLEARAKEKFPEEYARILKKCGAVEVISSSDGQIVGVSEPEEYLREADRLALERLERPGREADGLEIAVTSTALRSIAEGKLHQALADWQSIRTIPQALYEEIVHDAQTAGETLPDREGNSTTPSELLLEPRYVAQRVKYLAHNMLLIVGSWSIICEYLRDVQRLDETEGRFGALGTRKVLMSQVKNLLDQQFERQFRWFLRKAPLEPQWRPYFSRVMSHADYSGAAFIFNRQDDPNIVEQLRLQNIDSAILRLLAQPMPYTYAEHHFRDISNIVANSSEEDLSEISPDLVDAWAEIELTKEITNMIGAEGSNWGRLPEDDRFLKHASNVKRSIAIFEEADFESHITSAESLKSSSVCELIWQELDDTSLRIAGVTIEKVVAFAPVVPSWRHTRVDIPPPSPIEDQLELQLSAISFSAPYIQLPEEPREPTAAEAKTRPEVAAKTNEVPLPSTSDISSSPPKPKPVSYLSHRTVIPFPEPPEPRQGPKLKTRGQARPPDVNIEDEFEEDESHTERKIYYVGQKVYDTYHRLLVLNIGPMLWAEFEAPLKKMRFTKEPRGFRAFAFIPPPDAETTSEFPVRRYHRKISHIEVCKYGNRLHSQYGWTIDMFSPERRAPSQQSTSE